MHDTLNVRSRQAKIPEFPPAALQTMPCVGTVLPDGRIVFHVSPQNRATVKPKRSKGRKREDRWTLTRPAAVRTGKGVQSNG